MARHQDVLFKNLDVKTNYLDVRTENLFVTKAETLAARERERLNLNFTGRNAIRNGLGIAKSSFSRSLAASVSACDLLC